MVLQGISPKRLSLTLVSSGEGDKVREIFPRLLGAMDLSLYGLRLIISPCGAFVSMDEPTLELYAATHLFG
jgi:hypothetical protein